jgi:hypothetical protein
MRGYKGVAKKRLTNVDYQMADYRKVYASEIRKEALW